MSLSVEFQSDWDHAFPFRMLRLESEHDAPLGQWSVEFALLGLSMTLTWVYDPDTPLRKELAALMDDENILQNAKVWVAYPEFEQMKADAERVPALLERIRELEMQP